MVSCLPCAVCRNTQRIAVEPEKRQSTPDVLSPAAVSSYLHAYTREAVVLSKCYPLGDLGWESSCKLCLSQGKETRKEDRGDAPGVLLSSWVNDRVKLRVQVGLKASGQRQYKLLLGYRGS